MARPERLPEETPRPVEGLVLPSADQLVKSATQSERMPRLFTPQEFVDLVKRAKDNLRKDAMRRPELPGLTKKARYFQHTF